MQQDGLNVSDDLQKAWRLIIRAYPCPVIAREQSTALMSLLLNHFVHELQHTDSPTIRAEMETLADRLRTLAHTPAPQLDTVAQYLADEPRAGITRQ